ncbi:MAG: SDR family NAD(P)-dependent oxidoreductase, partial [Dehalococcoidia bacterium]|nr:SDR family NAD(P)-dependent oxidoreductase [Dehalococcoidia bacterium]
MAPTGTCALVPGALDCTAPLAGGQGKEGREEMILDGKVAIVTGSGRGIGKAIALALADAGADVVAVARTASLIEATAAEVRAKGRKAMAVPTDVCNRAEVTRMVQAVVEQFGKIDVLVNNVGGAKGAAADELEMTDEQWDYVFDLNAKSVFLCSQITARVMIPRRSGCIINISSGASLGPKVKFAHYAAAKAAVNHFSRSLAVAWGPHGIRVNVVAPSSVSTPVSEAYRAKVLGNDRIKRIPLGRWGTPEDTAGAVVFLASESASFINGA